jgi:hypothetical protein
MLSFRLQPEIKDSPLLPYPNAFVNLQTDTSPLAAPHFAVTQLLSAGLLKSEDRFPPFAETTTVALAKNSKTA